MSNRSAEIFGDARQDVRVKQNRRISWYLKDGRDRGQAKVRNISASGMLMETTSLIKPTADNCILSFDADLGSRNYIPQDGKLVWYKRKRHSKKRYLCGIEFCGTNDFVRSKLHLRIQKAAAFFSEMKRIEMILNVFVVVTIISLMGYIFWVGSAIYYDMTNTNKKLLSVSNQQSALTLSYFHRFQNSQLKIASLTNEVDYVQGLHQESENMLQSVNAELASTKAILAETESMLETAKAGSANLEGKLQSLKNLNEEQIVATRNQLQAQIVQLEEQKESLTSEVKVLTERLAYFNGEIKSPKEGKDLIALYKSKLKEVKSKMRNFTREAQAIKASALQERDRIRLILGNNGYFLKNGEVVEVDAKKYQEAGLGSDQAVKTPQSNRNVEIDVTFYD